MKKCCGTELNSITFSSSLIETVAHSKLCRRKQSLTGLLVSSAAVMELRLWLIRIAIFISCVCYVLGFSERFTHDVSASF